MNCSLSLPEHHFGPLGELCYHLILPECELCTTVGFGISALRRRLHNPVSETVVDNWKCMMNKFCMSSCGNLSAYSVKQVAFSLSTDVTKASRRWFESRPG
ncbi:hypothetical protein AB205_0038170 [Aquarana catesbeiana]|uniref:Uncharacterized protein n=1 Tax=Aquarana catesbeiana TaxID=8400 RepID=A0A2G9SFF9_AQUCT|nr:hypothetical protein AB205_0038170 [Aquarana catesbeiana]